MKKGSWWVLPAAFFFIVNFSISSAEYFFLKRIIYFSFLVFLFLFMRRFNFNRILPLVTAGISLIIFCYGIAQKYILFPIYIKNLSTADDYYSRALLHRIESGRIFSIFPLPTLYAIICVILILAIFHFFMRSIKGRPLWILLLILGGINLVLTQSFGGILFLSAGLLSYLTISGILNFRYVTPVVLILSFFFFILVGLRFSEAKKFEPITLRISNWKQAVRMIRLSPYLGVGLGNYESQISHLVRPNEGRSIYAHNFFLQMTAETGILVPIIVLVLIFLSRKKLKPDRSKEKIMYISILFVLILYNLVDIGIYFFSAGLIMSLTLSQIYPLSVENYDKKFKINLLLLFLSSIVLILISISDSLQRQGDFWMSQQNIADAEKYYQKSIKLNPFQFKSLSGYGQALLLGNRPEEAMKYLERAYRLNPDSPLVHYLLSKIAFRNQQYFRSLYHASTAFHQNSYNQGYEKWYEYLKDRLQIELAAAQS